MHMTETSVTKEPFTIWSYPQINTSVAPIHVEESDNPIDASTKESLANQEIEQHKQELNNQKNHLQEKINLIESITKQLQANLRDLNSAFINNTVNIIKKIAKQVILKELSQDEAVLKNMIDNAVHQISEKNKLSIIFIAKDDFDSINEYIKDLENTQIKVDSSLEKGDFRIKTQYSELESILEQRLANLFEHAV